MFKSRRFHDARIQLEQIVQKYPDYPGAKPMLDEIRRLFRAREEMTEASTLLLAAGLQPAAEELVAVPAAPEHVVELREAAAVAWEMLRRAAADDGVELLPVSGYRDPRRQVAIWNRNYQEGLDQGLSIENSLLRVLEYSAPPGWSRHHWGTEIDVISAELATRPRLDPVDWVDGGPCRAAGGWLETRAHEFGFRRPYDRDRGGFRPEPWHISYAPFARPLLQRLDRLDWSAWLSTRPYLGADLVLTDLENLYRRYVHGVSAELLAH